MPKSEQQIEMELKTMRSDIKSIKDVQVNSSNSSSQSFISNSILRRPDWAYRKNYNDPDSIECVFGYPIDPGPCDYIAQYLRGDIAFRLVNAYPDACWEGNITVSDDDESEDETEFESAYNSLAKKIKLISCVNKLDKAVGLGQFGVLFIGLRDGRSPSQPVSTSKKYGPNSILFLNPYTEKNCSILSYDQNPQSPRFGFPDMYRVVSGGLSSKGSVGLGTTTIEVHHSRIIHVAEGALENELIGVPRLLPVLNRLIDKEKIIGGSANMFWLNGRGGLLINSPKDSIIKDPDLLKKNMTDYAENLTRFLLTVGMDVKALEFSTPDPRPNIEVIYEAITAATSIPKRILVGSERGNLASSQDENNWNNKVKQRREGYCTESILKPIIDWFIARGILPAPINDEYAVVFPSLSALSEKDKSEIARNKSQALSTYVNTMDVESVMGPKQFMEDVLDEEYKPDTLEPDDTADSQADALSAEEDLPS